MENIFTTKPGVEHIMQENAKSKSHKYTTRRQMINIFAAEILLRFDSDQILHGRELNSAL